MVEEKKKNAFQKLKEGLDDKEEQLAIISLFVRLGVVVWSGFIVSLNYIELPGYSNEPKDITFPASLLTAAISTFGIEASRKNGSKKVTGKRKKLDANKDGKLTKEDFAMLRKGKKKKA